MSNWVAAVANVADNFDMLGEAATENAFEKLSFIMAAALTDAAGVSALRPLVEVMSGNEYAWLLYTCDAADEEDSVYLGGCRIIQKNKQNNS